MGNILSNNKFTHDVQKAVRRMSYRRGGLHLHCGWNRLDGLAQSQLALVSTSFLHLKKLKVGLKYTIFRDFPEISSNKIKTKTKTQRFSYFHKFKMKHSMCDFSKIMEGQCCTGCLMEGKYCSGDIMEG